MWINETDFGTKTNPRKCLGIITTTFLYYSSGPWRGREKVLGVRENVEDISGRMRKRVKEKLSLNKYYYNLIIFWPIFLNFYFVYFLKFMNCGWWYCQINLTNVISRDMFKYHKKFQVWQILILMTKSNLDFQHFFLIKSVFWCFIYINIWGFVVCVKYPL